MTYFTQVDTRRKRELQVVTLCFSHFAPPLLAALFVEPQAIWNPHTTSHFPLYDLRSCLRIHFVCSYTNKMNTLSL